MKKFATLLILVFGLCCTTEAATDAEAGVCFGTTSGMSVGEDRVDHYLKMFKRYANCTVVKGNLEITGLVGPNLNVSFLQNIEEITGYLLIAVNYIPWVPLDKLRVIRGRELLWGNYSVVISNNYNKEDPLQGMKYLKFKSLTEIVRGGVLLDDNPQLCFADKVNWKDILNPAERKRGKWKFDIDKQNPKASCSKCHPSCNGLCWGPGPGMCQTLTSVICSPSCDARCRGPGADDCCNIECAVGCTGPKSSNCLVCMNVNNSGSCEPFCPPEFTYDNAIQRLRKNPNYKFHFHDQCVDECPSNLLVEENSCVKSCRKNWHNDGSGKCVQCPQNNCHKECDGIGLVEGTLADETTVDSKNVDSFRGCNVIKGNLIFYSYVFTGDSHTDLPPLSIQNLTEAFKDVKVITGFLHIVAWPPELHDFSVFKSLERIDGMDLYKDVASLVIQDSISEGPFYLQNITSLGFTSLKTIAHGNVYIGYCSNLCYDRRVDWSVIIKAKITYDTFPGGVMLRKNKPDEQCSNETCSAECKNGCWGAGSSQCVACNNFSYKGQCIPSCLYNLGIYEVAGETECASCDPQCKFSCFGPGPGNCSECRNLMHNGECVETCPDNLWPDTVTGVCQKCHNSCALHGGEDRLCSGPNDTLDESGCNFCNFVATTTTLDQFRCLPLGQNVCPGSYYQLKRRPTVAARATCMPCFTGCQNCSGFRKEDCFHHVGDPDLVPILVPVVLLALAALAVFLVCHYRRKQTLKKRQRSMRVLGIDPQSPEEQYADPRARLMEPMTPSGVAPNQAQLRIVKEAELRIGKILGSGAFGTVHKGYWIPDLAPRERVKVPVAIKVLRDESSQVASNEILDEAFVMASCEHPNLVRLLGISLSHQIMLITQLMPLGNLLEYVRDNKDNIGSQHLLNWCLQITKGMRYLAEEKHLVHRDLAARNVLVKSPNHVRITDFGLAKLLDVNEDAYKAEGGKMPIKWLALESIQHRIFTQKSDVWSFGVTMWELMTFGKKPYEYVPAADVHILLEKGERLPQPHICTIDIYMLLIKCWTVDAEARPTFKELCEDLSKMARDPQRYLVVDNDGALNELPSPDTAEFLRTLAKEDNDDFPITDAEEYLHPQAVPGEDDSGFQLQHAPNMVPWKRQQQSSTSSQQPLLGIRSGSGRLVNGFDPRRNQWNSTSGYDRRLDSVQTTMTNLSSVSGSLPNGASTPFASVTNPLSSDLVCEGDDETMMDDVTLHPPFMHGHGGSVFNPRTISESSDVFTTMPMHAKRGDDMHPDMVECVMPDPHRGIRSREDSSTMRYSAEPVAMHRHETKPNGTAIPKPNVHFEHDEDGYLSPAEAANKKPEYFDTREFPPSPTSLFGPPNVFAMAPPSVSSVANPEYEATFPQTERRSPRKSAVDEAGYEVPLSAHDDTNLHNPDSVEYENTQAPPPATPSALSANHEAILTLRHSSQSGESSTSEKRDSGMQSDEDDPGGKKRPSAVANPIYVTTGHVSDDVTPVAVAQREDKTSPEYVNVCVDKGFKDDDIFTLLDEKKGAGLGPGVLGAKGVEGPVTRTYSEPDSGVGIEVAVDNLLYHKLGD